MSNDDPFGLRNLNQPKHSNPQKELDTGMNTMKNVAVGGAIVLGGLAAMQMIGGMIRRP